MTYLRFVRELDLIDITSEPTESNFVKAGAIEQPMITSNDIIIISTSLSAFFLFFSIYLFCRRRL